MREMQKKTFFIKNYFIPLHGRNQIKQKLICTKVTA